MANNIKYYINKFTDASGNDVDSIDGIKVYSDSDMTNELNLITASESMPISLEQIYVVYTGIPSNYFYVEALEEGVLRMEVNNSTGDAYYSENCDANGVWTALEKNTVSSANYRTLTLQKGDIRYIRCDSSELQITNINYFQDTTYSYGVGFNVGGNIASLIEPYNFESSTTMSGKMTNGVFSDLFSGSSVKNAENLDFPTITSEKCYSGMFKDCQSIIAGPMSLPATTLADYSYQGMFSGCTNLTAAPHILATECGKGSCKAMFWQCFSLVIPPDMEIISVGEQGCYDMFRECTKLECTPNIKVENVGKESFREMFYLDSSLVSATYELKPQTLGERSYYEMFRGCVKLETAPKLTSATTLDVGCCEFMFEDCKALKTVSDLPAEILREDCYKQMFQGCSSLSTPPVISASGINGSETGCCSGMFNGCTSLEYGPDLQILDVKSDCYKSMFEFCFSLKKLKIYATKINGATPYSGNVSSCFNNILKNANADADNYTESMGVLSFKNRNLKTAFEQVGCSGSGCGDNYIFDKTKWNLV